MLRRRMLRLYSMRQAIEEGFILDVLENYTTFKTYWSLLKKIEDDPSDPQLVQTVRRHGYRFVPPESAERI